MKHAKGILIVLLGIFLFITAISLFIPSKIVTVKAVAVNAPEDKIAEQLYKLENWKNWQPVFQQQEAGIKIDSGTAGFQTASWISGGKNATVQITSFTGNSVKFLLQKAGSKDVENEIGILPVAESKSGRQVQWRSITYLRWYPWEKFRGIFIEKMIGDGYETALDNLKKYLEK